MSSKPFAVVHRTTGMARSSSTTSTRGRSWRTATRLVTEMRRSSAIALSLVLIVLALAVSVSDPFRLTGAAHAAIRSSHWVQRCSIAGSPYGGLGGYTYIEKSQVPCHKGRPLIHQAPYTEGTFVLRSLSRRFIHCSPPTNVLDGGGYGNLEPLLVRRVTCTVGLKVATKRQCARHRTCVAANIHWTCSYKSIALETVRGWCHAPAGRKVKWTAGGPE